MVKKERQYNGQEGEAIQWSRRRDNTMVKKETIVLSLLLDHCIVSPSLNVASYHPFDIFKLF
jgi:hypothetical protein